MAGKGRPAPDRTGKHYGHLTVVGRAGSNDHGQALWECRCDCGATTVKSVVFFNNGGGQCSKSCPLGVHVKHGQATRMSKNKEYRAWQDMKRRCFNPAAPNYHRYGGRGIIVCAEWVDNFPAFLAHIGPAPEGHRPSIERVDNNAGYEPGNVRWVTPKAQTRNRQLTIMVTIAGETMPLAEAAERWDIKYPTVLARYHRGFRGGDLVIPHKRGPKLVPH